MVLAAASLFVATQASAAFITSRVAFGGNDMIDWGQFGLDFTPVANGSAGVSNGGINFTVSGGGQNLERRDQGTGWAGNFAAGDELIWTANGPGPLSIIFSTGVSGAGAQIQQDSFGAFTGMITAFDSLNNILEQYTLGGTSNSNGDNSAIFIGILRAGTDIARIEFDMSPNGQDFAINQVSLNGVPEPGILTLLGAGIAGMGFARRKK
jgi:hypothetical protein